MSSSGDAHGMKRRNFFGALAAAVGAGVTLEPLLRRLTGLRTPANGPDRITVRPHPQAVARTQNRPPTN